MKERQPTDNRTDPPQQVGRYELLTELGRGSMGRVFVAYDPNIERRVAIKILQPSFRVEPSEQAEFQRRFVVEARAAGRLSHPGIVAIYDAAIDPQSGLAYIAMELVEGASVAKLVERGRPLPAVAAAAISHQVALALDYAHGQGVVHRDIKPANILVGHDGRIRVLDFGIAKLSTEPHTTLGQVLGTPAYMSPEQVKGMPVDGRSDLFSLGAVLCECLTGDAPFDAETVATIVYKILHIEPVPIEDPELPLPEGLWEVMSHSLAKDPDERVASGKALALALEEFLPGRGDDTVLTDLLPRASLGHAPRTGDSDEAHPFSAAHGTFVFASSGSHAGEDLFARSRTSDPEHRILKRLFTPLTLSAMAALLLALLLSSVLRRSTPIAFLSTPDRVEQGVDGGDPNAEQPNAGPSEARSTEERLPSETLDNPEQATLIVLHENRLKSAWMTLWINGELATSERLSISGGFFARTRGRAVQTTILVPPGPQTIEVRIAGAKGKVDARKTTSVEFVAGETRLLRARLIPIVHNLDLDWQN